MDILSGLRQFIRWWVDELADLLPGGLRRTPYERMATLSLMPGVDDIALSRVNGTSAEELVRVPWGEQDHGAGFLSPDLTLLRNTLQRFDPTSTRVVVQVPKVQALSRSLQLPLAAEENLAQVLAYEMSRQTPFDVEDVYFDYRLAKREPAVRRIEVRLLLVPKRFVNDLLDRIVPDWNLRPAPRQFFHEDEGGGYQLAFLPAAYRPMSTARLNAGLVLANVLVFGVLVAMTISGQQATLERLRDRLGVVRGDALAVADMRKTLDDRGAALDLLRQYKLGSPAVVEVINELSILLDDETWLYSLELKDGQVHIQGTSNSASSLIARLEETDMFKGARFSSPVTREGASGRERFQLTVGIVPRGGG